MQEYDKDTEKLLTELMELDDGVNPKSPLGIEPQREAQKARYREALKLRPFQAMLELAIQTISEDFLPEMEPHEALQLSEDLTEAAKALSELRPEMTYETSPESMGVTGPSINHILNMASDCYVRMEYQKARALFTLLTVIHFQSPEFWFCLGSCEQELEDFHAASCAYELAASLEPDTALYELVAAECHLILDRKHQAEDCIGRAREIMEKFPPEGEALPELAADLEQQLRHLK